MASRPENRVEGVVAFLDEIGSTRSFADIVADWAVANFVDAPSGPYGYADIDVSAPTTDDAGASGEGIVNQFAADYIQIRAEEFQTGVEFSFNGATDVPLIAAQADSYGAFWWLGRRPAGVVRGGPGEGAAHVAAAHPAQATDPDGGLQTPQRDGPTHPGAADRRTAPAGATAHRVGAHPTPGPGPLSA